MPAALISGLITRLPILLIPEFFDMGVAGQYSRGFSILFVPLSLLAAAVAQVFFVRAVEANRSGTLGAFAGNVHARLVLMCFWPTVILMTAGADIFQVLFGEAWRDSASYLGFVAPWILFSVVASPLTRLFDVLERQRLELLATVLMLAVISATLFYGGQTGDIKVTLLALGIGGTVIRLGQIMLLLHLAGTSLTAMIRPYLSYIVWSLPLLGGIFWITTLGMPHSYYHRGDYWWAHLLCLYSIPRKTDLSYAPLPYSPSPGVMHGSFSNGFWLFAIAGYHCRAS